MIRRCRWLDDEHALFRETARELVRRSLGTSLAGGSAAAWQEASQVGLLLPDIPPEYGGSGGALPHVAVVLEELAETDLQERYLHLCLAGRGLMALGTEAQRRRWLPPMARGEVCPVMVPVVDSLDPGSFPAAVLVESSGDQFVVSGELHLPLDAQEIHLACVEVHAPPGFGATGPVRLLLDLPELGLVGTGGSTIQLRALEVTGSSFLGGVPGKPPADPRAEWAYACLLVALAAVTRALAALRMTGRYARDRVAFGRPLLEFPNTRRVLAEGLTRARIGQSFVDQCIEAAVAGALDPMAAAMARGWLTDSLRRTVDECLQLHGGYGYMTEYPIARMWAETRRQVAQAGPHDWATEFISAAL